MQVSCFTSGGFVAHKVYLTGYSSRFSIWGDDSGKLLDAERIDSHGRAYPVKRGSAAWKALEPKATQAMVRIKATGLRPFPRHIGEIVGTYI